MIKVSDEYLQSVVDSPYPVMAGVGQDVPLADVKMSDIKAICAELLERRAKDIVPVTLSEDEYRDYLAYLKSQQLVPLTDEEDIERR